MAGMVCQRLIFTEINEMNHMASYFLRFFGHIFTVTSDCSPE